MLLRDNLSFRKSVCENAHVVYQIFSLSLSLSLCPVEGKYDLQVVGNINFSFSWISMPHSGNVFGQLILSNLGIDLINSYQMLLL